MAPVFSREAWREFYGFIDPDNRSRWGYDYISLGRKGTVDAPPVVHTRAMQSMNAGSQAELQRFLDNQGLFRHAPVDGLAVRVITAARSDPPNARPDFRAGVFILPVGAGGP
jgi:hypothetical protein